MQFVLEEQEDEADELQNALAIAEACYVHLLQLAEYHLHLCLKF
jgi:hypothetical protein